MITSLCYFISLWVVVKNSEMIPIGTMYPPIQLLYTGSKAKFVCASATFPRLIAKGRDVFYCAHENNVLVDDNLYTFQLLNITEDEGGTYICYGSHKDRTPFVAESYLLVGDMDNHKIKTSNNRLTPGSMLKMNCFSRKVRWFHDRLNLKELNDRNMSLTINSIAYDDTGYYYCYGEQSNSTKHFLAVVPVRIYDQYKIFPNDNYVLHGDNSLIFVCYGKNVMWMFNNDNILPNNTYSQTSSILSILEARRENSGIFECYGELANKELFYAFGNLFVTDFLPFGVVYPKVQLVYANSHVNLKCISATHPRLVAKGKDLFYTSMENTAVVTNSYEFQVLVLSQNDIGNYVCYGTHDSGKPFATESKLILGDRVPTGTLYPTMQLAHVGSYASFKCSSATTPRLVVKWRDLFYNVVENIYTIENNLYEFVVHDLTEQDTGTYVCYGTHENQTFFTVESQLLVGVRVQGKVWPRFYEVQVGDTVIFNCKAHGIGRWYYDGFIFASNVEIGRNYHKRHEWLKILNVQQHNGGVYYCIGELESGSYFIDKGFLKVKSNEGLQEQRKIANNQ